ncbi:hypothetical protein GCM10025787_42890 [Saccharopolyspora rosea]
MRGNAFDTIVELRMATNSANIRPDMASRICRWVIGDPCEDSWRPSRSVDASGAVSRMVELVIEFLP